MTWTISDDRRIVTTVANCDRTHAESVLAALKSEPQFANTPLKLKNTTPWWAFWRR